MKRMMIVISLISLISMAMVASYQLGKRSGVQEGWLEFAGYTEFLTECYQGPLLAPALQYSQTYSNVTFNAPVLIEESEGLMVFITGGYFNMTDCEQRSAIQVVEGNL